MASNIHVKLFKCLPFDATVELKPGMEKFFCDGETFYASCGIYAVYVDNNFVGSVKNGESTNLPVVDLSYGSKYKYDAEMMKKLEKELHQFLIEGAMK